MYRVLYPVLLPYVATHGLTPKSTALAPDSPRRTLEKVNTLYFSSSQLWRLT